MTKRRRRPDRHRGWPGDDESEVGSRAVTDKAAVLTCRSVWNHPLADGNERAAKLTLDGVVSGQRYEHVSTKAGAEPAHRNLAVYELDGDPDIVMKAFTARVASGQLAISDALDMGSVSMAVWQSHGDRRES